MIYGHVKGMFLNTYNVKYNTQHKFINSERMSKPILDNYFSHFIAHTSHPDASKNSASDSAVLACEPRGSWMMIMMPVNCGKIFMQASLWLYFRIICI